MYPPPHIYPPPPYTQMNSLSALALVYILIVVQVEIGGLVLASLV
jgi:hypothetical protein